VTFVIDFSKKPRRTLFSYNFKELTGLLLQDKGVNVIENLRKLLFGLEWGMVFEKHDFVPECFIGKFEVTNYSRRKGRCDFSKITGVVR